MTSARARPGRHRRVAALLLATAAGMALSACHHAPPPPSNVTPEKAVATNLNLTASGDFDALMRNRLPPDDYTAWRTEWEKAHAHPIPASVAQEKQFAAIMQMLTEPDAEAKLAKRLQPELARMHGGKHQQLPILAGILEAAGKQMIDDSPQLGPAHRAIATQGLEALLGWARTTDFSDPGKARQAIALVCGTARSLHVKTLAEWRALDYAHTMQAYGTLWTGLEKLLDLYGLDLAGSLTNAKVTTTGNNGQQATVGLEMTFAGKPLQGKWSLVKQDGHWYDASVLEAWRKAHPAPSASTGAATAASNAAPATTTATPASPASGTVATPPASASTATPPAASSSKRHP